jgi:hypothetical protein
MRNFLVFFFQFGQSSSVRSASAQNRYLGPFLLMMVVAGPGDVAPILPFDSRSCDGHHGQSCLVEN